MIHSHAVWDDPLSPSCFRARAMNFKPSAADVKILAFTAREAEGTMVIEFLAHPVVDSLSINDFARALGPAIGSPYVHDRSGNQFSLNFEFKKAWWPWNARRQVEKEMLRAFVELCRFCGVPEKEMKAPHI